MDKLVRFIRLFCGDIISYRRYRSSLGTFLYIPWPKIVYVLFFISSAIVIILAIYWLHTNFTPPNDTGAGGNDNLQAVEVSMAELVEQYFEQPEFEVNKYVPHKMEDVVLRLELLRETLKEWTDDDESQVHTYAFKMFMSDFEPIKNWMSQLLAGTVESYTINHSFRAFRAAVIIVNNIHIFNDVVILGRILPDQMSPHEMQEILVRLLRSMESLNRLMGKYRAFQLTDLGIDPESINCVVVAMYQIQCIMDPLREIVMDYYELTGLPIPPELQEVTDVVEQVPNDSNNLRILVPIVIVVGVTIFIDLTFGLGLGSHIRSILVWGMGLG